MYRLLEQLEKEGLASSREEPRRDNQRRTRLVYHPTEQTAEALTVWMETLLPREPVRLGLQAKLAVARDEDAPRLLVALMEYQRECLRARAARLPDRRRGALLGGAVHGLHARRRLRACCRRRSTGPSSTRRRIDEYASRAR